jgi:hypothetical protein
MSGTWNRKSKSETKLTNGDYHTTSNMYRFQVINKTETKTCLHVIVLSSVTAVRIILIFWFQSAVSFNTRSRKALCILCSQQMWIIKRAGQILSYKPSSTRNWKVQRTKSFSSSIHCREIVGKKIDVFFCWNCNSIRRERKTFISVR